ncbi:MAG: MFS transporter, partial [Myxococcales bacterium]|nr:MFS transporter [Myxococcales bacterium]
FDDLRDRQAFPAKTQGDVWTSFQAAARDYRVWALFVVYAACFGVELTINNIAAIYFFDEFDLTLGTAGIIAGLFGLMNIFARTLGGMYSDRFARMDGLRGRVRFLFFCLLIEGIALVAFSRMHTLTAAIIMLLLFSLFVQMSEGATFGVVPFINRKALGGVAGIVGAGGNAGAVAAGFLIKSDSLSYGEGLMVLGFAVIACSGFAFAVRFKPATIEEEDRAFAQALASR